MYRLVVPLLLIFLPIFLTRIIRFCLLVWRLTFDKRVPLFLRALVPGALLYLIFPFDLLNDKIPVLGRLDDLLVIGLAVLLLVKLGPRYVVDARSGTGQNGARPPEIDPTKVVEGSGRIIDDDERL